MALNGRTLNRIAFHSIRRGGIWIVDAAGDNSVPVFSPDGRRIALMSSVAGQPPDIWVMNADGSGIAALTNERSYDASPDWMPDARHVTFKSMRGGRVGLWQVDVDTRREERLVDFGALEEVVRLQGFVQEAALALLGAWLVARRGTRVVRRTARGCVERLLSASRWRTRAAHHQ